jgi:surface antigen
MGKLLAFTVLAGLLGACSTPVASRQAADGSEYPPPACRTITGIADIDGAPQQISGLACLQPDGTWQIVQSDSGTLAYPLDWSDATTWYAGPWYGWWPPVFIGGTFVFVDRFHHFHHMDHVYPGVPHMRPVSGMHGGFHGGHGVWSGMGHSGGNGGMGGMGAGGHR